MDTDDQLNLPLEVLVHIALQMDLPELLNFCRSSRYIDNSICQDNRFWIKKLLKDYNVKYDPLRGNVREQYYITYRDQNFRNLIEQYRIRYDIFGTIRPGGKFKIYSDIDNRGRNRVPDCRYMTKEYIIEHLLRLGIPFEYAMTRGELCRRLQNVLQQMGRLIFY